MSIKYLGKSPKNMKLINPENYEGEFIQIRDSIFLKEAMIFLEI